MQKGLIILGIFLFSVFSGFVVAQSQIPTEIGPDVELMDGDEIYPPGVKVKITYKTESDLFHLVDPEYPNVTKLYATPEDLAFAIPSIAHLATDSKRKSELDGSREFTIEMGLPLFYPEDIGNRVKSLKKGQKTPAAKGK